MKEVSTIGLDLAENVFQVHGVDGSGKRVVRRQLRRGQILPFFKKLPPCLVGLEAQIETFVNHYNNHRYHESLGNVTPADVYLGRHTAIIERRKKIKKLTFQKRRLFHHKQAA